MSREQLQQGELFYPLHALVCSACFLVQLQEFESPSNIFTDYAYFSSYSDTWLDHARRYVDHVMPRFNLDERTTVIEIASNDGYLLQYFAGRRIPVLGIEPARNVATIAQQRGIPTLTRFFNLETATTLSSQGQMADLLVANNVLAHVPILNEFVGAMKVVLKPNGVITAEFPHLLRLIEANQFDTIYHEHFSYFSLLTIQRIFASHRLRLFDVQELSTHGGSLRIFATHAENDRHDISASVGAVIEAERGAGLEQLATYDAFAVSVNQAKRNILDFLIAAKNSGRRVVGYGAPAKGNTLLNFCGIGTDLLDYTVDRSPHKQGKFLPGSRLPIRHPDAVKETRPDYLFILPWNLEAEIRNQMAPIREWGGRFVVPIPAVKVID